MSDPIELSVVMPCLNEAETLGACIQKARGAIERLGIAGEVVVADNGSEDRSVEVAESHGARVIHVEQRGYGAALAGGIEEARGRCVIMGDADDSYDFSSIDPFVQELQAGCELVIGNRFAGGILPGAMPLKNRWIGNPLLSLIGRVFFSCPVRDFNCGLRGVAKEAYERMDLRTTGMEFASEMVIKASLLGMRITEVPTVLHPDGRPHRPHLRPWRDGWRHLRFMLLFSPKWLFLIPGLVLLASGILGVLWLAGGPRHLGPVTLDIHSMLMAGSACLLGYQLVIFALFTKVFAVDQSLQPAGMLPNWVLKHFDRALEMGVVLGTGMALVGVAGIAWATWGWRQLGFGDLEPTETMRALIPAAILVVSGAQTVFGGFFLGVLRLGRRSG